MEEMTGNHKIRATFQMAADNEHHVEILGFEEKTP